MKKRLQFMGDRKFEEIEGFEIPEEESEVETKDIDYGILVLKLEGEENPLVFDILTKDPKNKMFLMEFFLTFGKDLFEELKEKHES
jgi:hypothetical protein